MSVLPVLRSVIAKTLRDLANELENNRLSDLELYVIIEMYFKLLLLMHDRNTTIDQFEDMMKFFVLAWYIYTHMGRRYV
jgi:hypothetical protein